MIAFHYGKMDTENKIKAFWNNFFLNLKILGFTITFTREFSSDLIISEKYQKYIFISKKK